MPSKAGYLTGRPFGWLPGRPTAAGRGPSGIRSWQLSSSVVQNEDEPKIRESPGCGQKPGPFGFCACDRHFGVTAFGVTGLRMTRKQRSTDSLVLGFGPMHDST